MKKVTLKMDVERPKSRIAPEIYGQFSEHLGRCIYEGIYVGEDSKVPNVNGMRTDVVEALKKIKLPVLRWPGGCFADEYHWKDGIGPKEKRKPMVNTNWGGIVENNAFGTHEFMELCEQIGCEPYIALNMGSGTVQEAAEWVEYMTYDGDSELARLREQNGHKEPWKVKYIGIGNESWGCGGSMRPEYYADNYRKYRTFCRDLSGNELFPIACGPNADDYHWTDVIMPLLKWHTKAISLHYYTIPSGNWEHKGSATKFTKKEYYQTIRQTLRIEEIIEKHLKIMDYHDAEQNVGLIVDEWGTWYDVEPGTNPGFLYQQNTMRDALVAAINLNIFNKHSDRIIMANIAQVVNVLQAMILTEGMKIVKTPTYEVFDMYHNHQGTTLVDSVIDMVETGMDDIVIPALSESVSVTQKETGSFLSYITLSNASLEESVQVRVQLPVNQKFAGVAEIAMLSGEADAHNTFDNPECVQTQKRQEEWRGNNAIVTLPPCSVCSISCRVETDEFH
ncbi:MAG: alpha-L-arabinofuranosidase C-terminal domain-containing protein [Butyribacter sp.]|nr:alpha-L-arabinofuranosidase C-terminal domain-containing protein [bacterium]MDY3854608.1 alpha-L-arabinofuranosidase C-terminal domain-containing protein [Butyribacter sp.]